MIELDDQYVLRIFSSDFCLYRRTKNDQDEYTDRLALVGSYMALTGPLKRYIDERLRDDLKDLKDVSSVVTDALKCINEAKDYIKAKYDECRLQQL
jgi:hypothetical protein